MGCLQLRPVSGTHPDPVGRDDSRRRFAGWLSSAGAAAGDRARGDRRARSQTARAALGLDASRAGLRSPGARGCARLRARHSRSGGARCVRGQPTTRGGRRPIGPNAARPAARALRRARAPSAARVSRPAPSTDGAPRSGRWSRVAESTGPESARAQPAAVAHSTRRPWRRPRVPRRRAAHGGAGGARRAGAVGSARGDRELRSVPRTLRDVAALRGCRDLRCPALRSLDAAA